MNWLKVIAPILISSGLLAAVCKWMVGQINKSLKSSKAHEQAIENGMRSMLRDRILQLARFCLANGYAPLKDRENFESLYNSYRELGGNGVVEDIAEQFHALPLMPPNEQMDHA